MSNVYSAALEAKAALYDKLMKKENLPGTYGVSACTYSTCLLILFSKFHAHMLEALFAMY